MTRNNTIFNWCTNNYHTRLMWCTSILCYNQTDFKKKMKEKKEDKMGKCGKKKYQPSNNFKIALLAILLDKDLKKLEDQF
eukprot:7712321-Ditylum_brightwellii.AAC.1